MGDAFLQKLQAIYGWSASNQDATSLAWNEGVQVDQTLLFSIQEREQGPATKGLTKKM